MEFVPSSAGLRSICSRRTKFGNWACMIVVVLASDTIDACVQLSATPSASLTKSLSTKWGTRLPCGFGLRNMERRNDLLSSALITRVVYLVGYNIRDLVRRVSIVAWPAVTEIFTSTSLSVCFIAACCWFVSRVCWVVWSWFAFRFYCLPFCPLPPIASDAHADFPFNVYFGFSYYVPI